MIAVAVDDCGTNAIAGPIVAGAVVYDTQLPNHYLVGIRDSKYLAKKGRQQLEDWFYKIKGNCLAWAVAQIPAHVIDGFNKQQSALKVMARAVAKATEKYRGVLNTVYIDGDSKLPLYEYNMRVAQVTFKQGDVRIPPISAASIIARFIRDTLMEDLHLDDGLAPYGFNKNHGHSTPQHRSAIEKYGPSQHHRLRFKEVKKANKLHESVKKVLSVDNVGKILQEKQENA